MIFLHVFLLVYSYLFPVLNDQIVIFEPFDNLHNWESFEFSGKTKSTDYQIILNDTLSYLQAISRSSASGLIHKTRFNAREYPKLQWRWQIEHAECDVDGREKSGDDYPLRIFVLFDDDSADFSFWESVSNSAIRLFYGFEVPGSSLCFVWTNLIYDEKYFNNPHSDRVKIIPLTTEKDSGVKWVTHRIRIDSVFQHIYNRACPEKAALAIMSDTDNTGGSAIANLDFISVGK